MAPMQRRENLTRPADEVRLQLEDAKALGRAFEELRNAELLEQHDQAHKTHLEIARKHHQHELMG